MGAGTVGLRGKMRRRPSAINTNPTNQGCVTESPAEDFGFQKDYTEQDLEGLSAYVNKGIIKP